MTMPPSFRPTNSGSNGQKFPSSFKPIEKISTANPEEQLASTLEKSARSAVQLPKGALHFTGPGAILDLWEILGKGESAAGLQELEENLPRLKKLFPNLNWPATIDKEKYSQASETATGIIPTVEHLAEAGEELTGLPLAAKGEWDENMEFLGGAAKLATGSPAQKFQAALKMLTVKSAMETAGVPKEASGILSLMYGLMQRTPKIKKQSTSITNPSTQVNISGGPPPGGPPPSPPAAPPSAKTPGNFHPGSTIPETKSAFAEKEDIIKELHRQEIPPALGLNVKMGEGAEQTPTLTGRTSEAKELGEVVSKEPFETEAQAGRTLAKDVTSAQETENEIVKDKYKKSDKITSSHEDFYPKLASENENRISRLESIEKRNAGEESVYQDALTLRKIIGEPNALIEANAYRIMRQSNSFSKKINYELPYAGYKGEIKKMVHEMNEAVIESLEKAGKDAATVKDADATFGRFADRFMNDEISPFLQKKILNPEALGEKAISDSGVYRAVKNAIGPRTTPVINKLDREVVHRMMDKYYKDPSKVNSKEYIKDLKNLAEKIGKEKIAEVDHFLRQRQLNAEKKAFFERKLKESDLARQGFKTRQAQKPEPIKLQEPIVKEPEQIDKLFKSRSDIRRLRKNMKAKGQGKEFDKLAAQKVEEILKEGGFGEKKIIGSDLKRIIDKHHEILSELLGEDEVSLLYKIASKAGKDELTAEIVKHVAKAAGKLAANFLGVGKLIKLIPLNRI